MAALLACIGGLPLAAAQSHVVTRWQKVIRQADDQLRAGEWRRVRKRMNQLLDEMTGTIESGPGAGWYLGNGAALRAVAEAGLGNQRDAAWDWQMAVSLHPDYEGMDLARYGEAGTKLQRILDEAVDMASGPQDPTRVQPPQKKHAPQPKYPLAKKMACLEESVAVEAIIGVDGLPYRPQLHSRVYPVMGFAVMESLRKWRFEPARLDGEPVAVLYHLRINFAMRRCSEVSG